MKADALLVIGAGFLGRAIALKLTGTGRCVTVLSPHAEAEIWPEGVAAVSGRQEDGALVASLLAGHDMVIHTAWGTTPGSSAERPELEAAAGLHPFLTFLDVLQRFPDRRLLFLSSGGTVYGEPARLPVAEEAPLNPRSCHGAGKAAAELFLGLRPRERTVVLRPSNIYGPGQPLRSGFGAIRHLLLCAAEGRPFQQWGDGSQVRDYLYIDDFTAAVCRVVERDALYGAFNIGSGSGASLRELIELAGRVSGRRIQVAPGLARSGDVSRIVLDIGRLRQATAWAPCVPLEEGMALAWREVGGRR